MNETQLSNLLQAVRDSLDLQLQLGQEVQRMHSQLIAARCLAVALAETHPDPAALAEKYMAMMDQVADTYSATKARLLRDDMNTVLQQLLALQRTPGTLQPPSAS